jgi:hypothetical protein
MDEKTKKQLIMLGAMLLVLLVVVLVTMKPKPKKPPVPISVIASDLKLPDNAQVVPQKPKTLYGIAKQSELDDQKKSAAGEWKRDPFYNKMRTEVYQSSNLQLKGISMGNNKRYVFINDQILTLGDVIAGHKLVEIEKTKVLLQKGSDRFYLQLPEE